MILGATITGSLTLNGVNLASITGSEASINALNSFTASAATTGSNVFKSNQTVTGSLDITGSLTVVGPITGTVTTASYVLNAVSASYALNATTASYALASTSASYALVASTASFADTFTVAGTLTAQKLVVQTITSSILYSSGSNIFGNSLSNTQSMTGSVSITGSLSVNGASSIVGTGTANYVPKFTAVSTIGDSLFYDNGTLTAVGNRVSTNSFVGLVRNFNVLGTDAAVRVARYTDSYATLHPTVEMLNYSDDGVYRRFYWDNFVNGSDSYGIRQRLTGGGPTTNGTVVDQTRLTIFSGGNVGINTTTDAGYKLDVNGTVNLSGALSGTSATFSGTSGVTLTTNGVSGQWSTRINGNSTAGSSYGLGVYAGINSSDDSFRVHSYSGTQYFAVRGDGLATFSGTNANIQLGATAAIATSDNLRHIFAGIGAFIGQDTNGEANIGNNIYYSTGFKRRVTGFASNVRFNDGNIYLQVAASGAADSAITWTNALTIASTGEATFSGAISLSGTTLPAAGTARLFSRSSDNSTYLQSGSGNTINLLDGSQNTMASLSSTSISFSISNTPKLTIASTGNVGIGTTSPSALLNTYSATTATQIIVTGADTTNQRLEVTDGTVTNRFGIFGRTNGDAGVVGTQTNHALLLQTNATTRLTIASTGAATFSGNIVQSGTSNIIQQSASNSYTGGSVLDIYNISATGYGIYVQGGGTSQYSLSVNNYAGTNLLTILGSGAATFSSSVKATTGFNSLTDTIGVANVTWVTIYNIPATQAAEGVYNVYAHYNDDSGGMAFTQILADRTHLREINNSDGATVLIQLSGRNIQVYQSYGTTVNIDWSILIQKLR